MSLEEAVYEVAFEALRRSSPELVDAISDLLAVGQTPAQIERVIKAKLRQNGEPPDIAHVARGAAEHLRRIG